MKESLLYGVTFRTANGARRDEAAEEAFIKAQLLGDCGPIFIEFADKRYRVMLAVRQVDPKGNYVTDAEDVKA